MIWYAASENMNSHNEFTDITRVKGHKKGIFLVTPEAKRVKARVKSIVKDHRNSPMYLLAL